jgi:spore germination protein YaaH/SH3-like domain-containing protein
MPQSRSTGIIIGLILVILLVAALILPPASLPERLATRGMVKAEASTDSDIHDPDGTQVAFPAYGAAGAFRSKLSSVPREEFVAGRAGDELKAAADQIALGNYLVPKSPLYDLEIKGQEPLASVLTVPIPNDSQPYETLDLYEWTGDAWRFVPSHIVRENDVVLSELNYVPASFMVMQTNRQPPTAVADVPAAETVPDAGRDALTEATSAGFSLNGDGTISGNMAANTSAGGSYAVMPAIRNWGDDGVVRTDLLDNLLLSQDLQATHLNAIMTLVNGGNYPGVELDYRGLDPTLSADFTHFVTTLATELHASNKQLTLRVEAPRQIAEDRWTTGGYDWRALGEVVDTFRIPLPNDPNAYIPQGQADGLLRWAVGEVPRDKIEAIIPAQSVEKAGTYLLAKSYSEALAPLLGEGRTSQPVLVPGEPVDVSLFNDRMIDPLTFDEETGMFTYSYRDNAGYLRWVWLENAASVARKLQLISTYNLKGAVLQHMLAGDYDPDIWSVVREYLAGETPARQSSYNVIWTVTGPDGQTVNEARPLDASGFSYTPPQSEGDVQFKVSIADSGKMLASAPVFSLVMATATPEATPTPAATPTPEATPTPAATPTPDFAFVVPNQTVNLRSGPGTAYSRIGQAAAGQTYRILGKNQDGSWWQIQLPDGAEAWIVGNLVQARGPIDQVEVAANIPEAPQQVAAAAQPAATSGSSAPAAAPAPSRASTGFFGYGIQAHMIHNDQANQVMQVTKNMGFNWVKQQIEWKAFEASQGQIDWSEMDRLVNTANGQGVSLLFSVVNAPAWARGGGDLSVGGPPSDPNTFANFLGQMAGKYCGSSLKAIEVWNEQNLHYEWGNMTIDPAAYMRLLKPAYNAIKNACPQMIVVSGALTPTGAPAPWAMDDFAYLEGMYQNGLKGYADAIGAHPSGYNVPPDVGYQDACATIQRTGNSFNGPCDAVHHSWSFRSTMEGYRNIMVKYGDSAKRIWPTEFGWAAGGAFDDRYKYANDNDFNEQAQWTVRAYQMMKNWGFVGPAFLWNLNFRVVANGTEKAQWGIVDAGWGPLPAYTALQQMPK